LARTVFTNIVQAELIDSCTCGVDTVEEHPFVTRLADVVDELV
jgi:hypothetical protein